MNAILESTVNLNTRDARTRNAITLGKAVVRALPVSNDSHVLVYVRVDYSQSNSIPYRIEAEGFSPKRSMGRVGNIRSESGELIHTRTEEFEFKKGTGFEQSNILIEFYHMNGPPVGRADIIIEKQPDGSYIAREA